MKYSQSILFSAICLMGMGLSGCFLDSDDGGSPSGSVVQGSVFKGPFAGGGSVNLYAWDASQSKGRGDRLAAGTIDSSAGYSLRLNREYSGPVVVEASGNYTSEVNGETKNSGSSLESMGFVPTGADDSTKTQVEVNPINHMVAQSFLNNPGVLTKNKFNQVESNIAGNLGFPVGTSLQSLKPVDVNTSSSTGVTAAKAHMALLLAGIEQSIATTDYASFVNNRLSLISNGSVPVAVQNVISSGVSQFTSGGRSLDSAIQSRLASASNTLGWTRSTLTDFLAPSVDVSFTTTEASLRNVTAGTSVSVQAMVGATPSQSYSWFWHSRKGSTLTTLGSGTSTGSSMFSTQYTPQTSGTHSLEFAVDYGAEGMPHDSVSLSVTGQSQTTAPDISAVIGKSWELSGGNRFGLSDGQMLFSTSAGEGSNGTTGALHFSHIDNDNNRYLQKGHWKLENNEFGLYFSEKYTVQSTGQTLMMTPTDIEGGAYTFSVANEGLQLSLDGVMGSSVLTQATHCDDGDTTALTEIKLYNETSSNCMALSAISTSVIALSSKKFHLNQTAGDTRRVGMAIFKPDHTFFATRRDTVATQASIALSGTWMLNGTSLEMTTTSSYSIDGTTFSSVSTDLSEKSTYSLRPTTIAGQLEARAQTVDSTQRAPLMVQTEGIDLEPTTLCGAGLLQINTLSQASGASAEPAFNDADCADLP